MYKINLPQIKLSNIIAVLMIFQFILVHNEETRAQISEEIMRKINTEIIIKFDRNIITFAPGERITSINALRDGTEIKTYFSTYHPNVIFEKVVPHFQPKDTLIVNKRGESKRRNDWSRIVVARFPQELLTIKIVEKLKNIQGVEYVHRQGTIQTQITPNDFNGENEDQWNLTKVRAEEAWDIGKGGNNVAVLGVAGITTHPDLDSKVVLRESGGTGDHPLNVAGVIGPLTNNNVGIAGLGWDTNIAGIYVGTTFTTAANAILRAAEDPPSGFGFKILNASWRARISVGGCWEDYNAPVIGDAVEDAITIYGRIFVASAGNPKLSNDCYDKPQTQWPAAYDGVVGVSATNQSDIFPSGYNFGSFVDLSAPGIDIPTLISGNDYDPVSGTSFSAPHVTALADLVWTIDPSLTNTEVVSLMQTTSFDLGTTGRDDYYGFGRIDAYEAVKKAATPIEVATASSSSNPGETEITVSWTYPDPPGYNYTFTIQRKKRINYWENVTSGETGISWPDTDLSFGKTFEYRVQVVSEFGFNSAWVYTNPVNIRHMESLSQNATGLNTGRRMVRESSGTYHLVYEDGGDIYYTNSSNNGSTWSNEVMLSRGDGKSYDPSIALDKKNDNNNLTVVWEYIIGDDGVDEFKEIHWNRKEQGSWNSSDQITGFFVVPIGHKAAPVVAGNISAWQGSGSVVAVWDSDTDLQIAIYPNSAGNGWDIDHVAGTFEGAKYPSIDFDTDQQYFRVGIAWQGGGNDIWFKSVDISVIHQLTWNTQWKLNNGFMSSENNYKPSYTLEGFMSSEPSQEKNYVAWWGQYNEIPSLPPPLFKSTIKITSVGTLRKSIFFRKKTGSGWGNMVEFQHGSHYETDPSIASYTNNDDLIIVWKCASHLAAVQYSSGSWGSINDFSNSGHFPNLNTGSTQSRIAWADPPSPYDILTSSTNFIPMSKITSAIEESVLIKKRKGYINLSPGDTTNISPPEIIFELLEPLIVRTGSREKISFHPLNTDSNPDWLNTNSFDIPSDADSLLIAYKFVVRNIYPDLIAELKPKTKIFELRLKNETNSSKGIHLTTVRAEDLSAATDSVFIIRELIRLPAKLLRGDKTQLTVNLYGKDKGVLPGYTEVYYYPAVDDSLNKAANRYAIRDLSDQIIPVEYGLSQNYPNPFNPETSIDFALPEAGHTRIVIYDLLGREVTRLVDSNMSAGYHNVIWNASNVASGIYFYRLTSSDFVSTKKMVLLR